jgi:hypothetical protein
LVQRRWEVVEGGGAGRASGVKLKMMHGAVWSVRLHLRYVGATKYGSSGGCVDGGGEGGCVGGGGRDGRDGSVGVGTLDGMKLYILS